MKSWKTYASLLLAFGLHVSLSGAAAPALTPAQQKQEQAAEAATQKAAAAQTHYQAAIAAQSTAVRQAHQKAAASKGYSVQSVSVQAQVSLAGLKNVAKSAAAAANLYNGTCNTAANVDAAYAGSFWLSASAKKYWQTQAQNWRLEGAAAINLSNQFTGFVNSLRVGMTVNRQFGNLGSVVGSIAP